MQRELSRAYNRATTPQDPKRAVLGIINSLLPDLRGKKQISNPVSLEENSIPLWPAQGLGFFFCLYVFSVLANWEGGIKDKKGMHALFFFDKATDTEGLGFALISVEIVF